VAVFLANAYLDMGTWWCITPFIGAGVGTVRHEISGITDLGPNPFGIGFGLPVSAFANGDGDFNHRVKWQTAWALHAGLAYNVTNTFKVKLSYRYLNMGDAETPMHRLQHELGERHSRLRAQLQPDGFSSRSGRDADQPDRQHQRRYL
jgi:opacity protein-like surface antigen